MTKLTEAHAKLTRTEEQIGKAQEEIESLLGQISSTQDNLTRELSLPDMDETIVKNLENEKEGLEAQKSRLSARILALQSTLDSQELGIAEYELKDAIKQHKRKVEECDGALSTYRIQAPELTASLKGMCDLLRQKKGAVSDAKDRADYFAALLGVERPELPTYDDLKREDLDPIVHDLHRFYDTRLDPRRASKFSEKLRLLTKARQEKEQAASIAKSQAENALAGW